MRGAVLYAPGNVRLDQRDDLSIIQPNDAVIHMSATSVCGSTGCGPTRAARRALPEEAEQDRPDRASWRTFGTWCPRDGGRCRCEPVHPAEQRRRFDPTWPPLR
jgi:hypothetical protein